MREGGRERERERERGRGRERETETEADRESRDTQRETESAIVDYISILGFLMSFANKIFTIRQKEIVSSIPSRKNKKG